MDNNTINNMEDLEQLKSQFQMMKQQLDKQEIISDRLLRQTFKSKVKSINSVKSFSLGCAIFVVLVAPFAFHYNPVVNASWPFIIGTDLFMSFCVYLTFRMHKKMTLSAADANLLQFAETAKELKKDYQDYLKYALPICAVWILWLLYEVFKHTTDMRAAIGTVVAMLIGGTVGAIIGMRQNKKVIAECQSIIDEIQGE